MKKLLIAFFTIIPVYIYGQDSIITFDNTHWCKENLKVTHFQNGDPLLQVTNVKEFNYATDNEIPAYMEVDFKKNNHKKYGYVYNGYAVFDSRGLIPDGYSLPNYKDWKSLNSQHQLKDSVKLHAKYKRKHLCDGYLNFYLKGIEFAYGVAYQKSKNNLNIKLWNSTTSKKSGFSQVTIFNTEDRIESIFTSYYEDLSNLGFVKCVKKSSGDSLKNQSIKYNKRTKIDFTNDVFNYYDLMIADTILFDFAVYYSEFEKDFNNDDPNSIDIPDQKVINFLTKVYSDSYSFLSIKRLKNTIMSKVVIIYHNESKIYKKIE